MKESGIVRKLDNLGRLVIPKEMRELFSLDKQVELIVTDEGVLLRSPQYKLTRRNEENSDTTK